MRKLLVVSVCSLGFFVFLSLWLAGRARLLALDIPTGPAGRDIRLEQDGECFSVYHGAYRGVDPAGPALTIEKPPLVIVPPPNFHFGFDPPDAPPESRRWFLLRFPNWYALVLFALGLLGPSARARLLQPRGEVSTEPRPSGWRVRVCDGALLVGLVLISVGLFWVGSLGGVFGAGPYLPRVLFGAGLGLGATAWFGYAALGRRA